MIETIKAAAGFFLLVTGLIILVYNFRTFRLAYLIKNEEEKDTPPIIPLAGSIFAGTGVYVITNNVFAAIIPALFDFGGLHLLLRPILLRKEETK